VKNSIAAAVLGVLDFFCWTLQKTAFFQFKESAYFNRPWRTASRLQTYSQYLEAFKKMKSVSKIRILFPHKSL